jgi:two-component sensor histidine kinase
LQPAASCGVAPVRRPATATTRHFPESSPAAEPDAGAERYRPLFDVIDDGFCVIEMIFDEAGKPVDYRFIDLNPAFERQTGLSNALGRRMRELAPGHEQHWFDIYGRVATTGEPARLENDAVALDRVFAVEACRIDTPELRHIAVLFRDITDKRRIESALHESEQRYRAFVNASEDVVYRMSADWSEMRQLDGQGFIADTAEPDTGWMERYILAEDKPMVDAAIEKAIRERAMFDLEHRVIRTDGSAGWTRSRAIPILDPAGEIMEWLGAATDVTAKRQMADRQSVLVAELQHRVRNILTVIRSVFQRTVEMTPDAREVADHFTGRLDTMARTQVLAARNAARIVDLENLIRDELLSVGVRDGPELSISGPDVTLPFDMAEPVALAIHELTTNALKYGALQASGAKLDVRWENNLNYGGQRQLDLYWTESGVPAVSASPVRKGFGRELIEEALPYRLGAKTDMKFAGNGVRCSISIPLPGEGVEASL